MSEESKETPVTRALPFGRTQAILLIVVLVLVGGIVVYKSHASSNSGWAKLAAANSCPINTKGVPETIAIGSRSSCVKFAQFLVQLGDGHIGGPPSQTGVYDDKTASYIEQFQTQNGLLSNGVIGPATWNKLNSCINQGAVTISNTWACQKLTP